MGVESSPTKPSDLNASWPLASETRQEGDDHLRNIKAVVKAYLAAEAGTTMESGPLVSALAPAGLVLLAGPAGSTGDGPADDWGGTWTQQGTLTTSTGYEVDVWLCTVSPSP